MLVLIIEDGTGTGGRLSGALQSAGFRTAVAFGVEDGLHLALEEEPDLILLDMADSGKDGLAALQAVRKRQPDVPIITLASKAGVHSAVSFLEEGANDYVIKPLSVRELAARVRAHLRQRNTMTAFVLEAGDLTLDLKTREAARGDRRVLLTATEFRLLELLMRHVGQVLDRAQMLSHVWGYDYDAGSNVVDVYIGYLRRKLGLRVGSPRIETVRGYGYRLVA